MTRKPDKEQPRKRTREIEDTNRDKARLRSRTIKPNRRLNRGKGNARIKK